MTPQPRLSALVFPFFVCCLLLACSSSLSAQTANGMSAPPTATAGQIIISEFRFRGSMGDNDEFIEIYNNSGADHIVTSLLGSDGYGVVASDGVLRCLIPNGTPIPNKGHYLCVNSTAYSLGTYATANASYTLDIPVNAGIAIFNNNDDETGYVLANRLDAVGSTSEANTLYREGAGYTPLTSMSLHQSLYRDLCGKGGNVTTGGLCTNETPKDTDNNAADFVYVNTDGTDVGHGRRLGAPGPENLSSPILHNNDIPAFLLDATKSSAEEPNRVRETTMVGDNADLGTMTLRRRFVNNTGSNVTRLRFRIIDITTLFAPAPFADLRAMTSSPVFPLPLPPVGGINDSATCTATGTPTTPPCTVTVQQTNLEDPPTQDFGGGFNSSWSAPSVGGGRSQQQYVTSGDSLISLTYPLAPDASINLQFQVGVQQSGNYRVWVNVEALTGGVIIEGIDDAHPTGGTSFKTRKGIVLPPQMEDAKQTLSPRKDTAVWLAVVPPFKSENLSRLEITALPAKEIETPREVSQPEVAPATNDVVGIEGTTRPETEARPAKNAKATLKEMLAQFGSLTETPEGFQLAVPESIWMGVRSATLVANDTNVASLATLLAENLNYGIVIEVYTDNQGEAKALQQLTQARAQALQEGLQAAGVDASRIQARGMGAANPLLKKATAAEKARDRRTLITLTLSAKQTAAK